MGRSVKAEVLGAHGRTVEQQETAAFEDAVDDCGGQVVVVQNGTPCVGMLVRGEDHRALRLMTMANDVVEHVRRVGSVAEIADLVDDESTCGAT